jgi:hypothetical protein
MTNTVKQLIDMDKTEVIRLIKEWIKADTEINEIKKIEKSKKHARQELSEQLSSLMKTNNVDCFDVADGQIVYNSRTTKNPQKSLTILLNKYYKEDAEQADELNKYIMDNRRRPRRFIVHKIRNRRS